VQVKPNLETPVFIKVLQDIGEVQVDDDAVTMKKGDVKVSLSPPLFLIVTTLSR
jgi:hypothetical protein